VVTSYAVELDAPAAIGRATAVMMSKYGVDVDRARTLLAKIAQRGEVPVETMARFVVSTAVQPRVAVRA
jgi:antitoxin component of RelBE/YafQ-DinJ toxin-antitoxin module